jgi:hypothetical protein
MRLYEKMFKIDDRDLYFDICVKFIASKSLNFQSVRDLVLNHKFGQTIAVEQNKFIRD